MDVATLNNKFGIWNEPCFKEIVAGITAFKVNTPLATASISSIGASPVLAVQEPTRACPFGF